LNLPAAGRFKADGARSFIKAAASVCLLIRFGKYGNPEGQVILKKIHAKFLILLIVIIMRL